MLDLYRWPFCNSYPSQGYYCSILQGVYMDTQHVFGSTINWSLFGPFYYLWFKQQQRLFRHKRKKYRLERKDILEPCIKKTIKNTHNHVHGTKHHILAENSSKICLSNYIYLLMISAWRFSTKNTLISTIRTDNNHTLTVRVTAFPSYALNVLHAQ